MQQLRGGIGGADQHCSEQEGGQEGAGGRVRQGKETARLKEDELREAKLVEESLEQ